MLADTGTHGVGTDLCQPEDGRENSKHSCLIVNYYSCTHTLARTHRGVFTPPFPQHLIPNSFHPLMALCALCVTELLLINICFTSLGQSRTQLILGDVLIPTRSVPTGGIISFPTGGQNVCNEAGRANRQVLRLKSGE